MRRFCRYSLRTLLIAVTLACLWIGFRANRAYHQHRAVELLRKHDDGAIRYDRRVEDVCVPAAVRRLLGDEFFVNLTEVHLTGGITSENLPAVIDRLANVGTLETVYLWDAKLKDDDFRHLAKLTQISHLGIHFPWQHVTGAGLEHVASMTNLRHLHVSGHFIQNEPLRHVGQLASLETLHVGWHGIDGRGLGHLAGCDRLKSLTLSRVRCDAQSLKAIAQIETLETICFENMEFEDSPPGTSPSSTARFFDENRPVLSGVARFDANRLQYQSTRFAELEAWLQARRPGISVHWLYHDP